MHLPAYLATAHRFGLHARRPHSAGGVYVTFMDLDRSVRLLQENIHLATMVPGPKEPSLEQLNHTLEPVVHDMQVLYGGQW